MTKQDDSGRLKHDRSQYRKPWEEIDVEQNTAPTSPMQEFFGDPIHVYTRAQAIEDGVLVDVSELAREAGFRWPVAITAGVWVLINSIPENQRHQDPAGRLWDLLMVLRHAAAKSDRSELLFDVIMHHGRQTYARFKSMAGPGDDGEPVITVLLPHED